MFLDGKIYQGFLTHAQGGSESFQDWLETWIEEGTPQASKGEIISKQKGVYMPRHIGMGKYFEVRSSVWLEARMLVGMRQEGLISGGLMGVAFRELSPFIQGWSYIAVPPEAV